MASVHLPNELWCSAWEYLSIMECFAIAQVCRSWRRTACAWPRLWTQLSFDYYPKSNRIPYNRFGGFFPYGRQLETKPYETWLVITEVQLLDLFAERSAPMLLKFKIKVLRDCVGDEKDQAERLVEFSQLLARNASRLRSLVITTDSVILVQKILSGLPRCLPHLETLFIGDWDQRGDPIDLDFDTPALKNLQLYGLVPSRDLFNLTTSSLRLLDGGVYDSQDALRLLACAGTVQELQVEVHSNFHPTDAETQMIRQRLPPRLDTLQLRCHFNTDMTHGYALSNFYTAAIRDCSLFLYSLDDDDHQGFLADVTQPSDIWCLLWGKSEEAYMVRGNERTRTIHIPKFDSQWRNPFLRNLWAQLAPCAVNTVVKLAVHSQLVHKVMRHIPCENAIQELRFYFEPGHQSEFGLFELDLQRIAEDEDYNVSLPKLQVLVLCIDRSDPERERPTILWKKPSKIAVKLSKALGLDGERPLQRLEFRELRFREVDPAATSCPWQSLAQEVVYT